jgi:hypothetical protein
MGLIIPDGPDWQAYSNNLSATPTQPGTASPGTAVTSSATANTDGSDVSLMTFDYDVELLEIIINRPWTTGESSALLDILIDPSGGTSWLTSPLITDLLCGNSRHTAGQSAAQYYLFPLRIPSGAAIGARIRDVVASALPAHVAVHAYGRPANPGMWWAGQGVESIGIDAANSHGTSHTPGNSGSYSSWTNFGSPITRNAKAVVWATQGQPSGVFTDHGYYIEFGIGGNRIGPVLVFQGGSAETVQKFGTAFGYKNIPSGTQLQVRGTGSGPTAAPSVSLAAYLVY